jgi:glyoxylase I family protein
MKIEHVAFNVSDPKSMARWYVEHLGFRVKRHMDDAPWAHFLADSSGQVMIEIYHNDAAPVLDFAQTDPSSLHVAFVSDDVAADRNRLLAAGASSEGGIVRIGDDEIAMLRDPWGLAVQLVRRAQQMV